MKMKNLLLVTAVTVAVNLSVPAAACDPNVLCTGTVSASGGWLVVDRQFTHCRVKMGSEDARLILRSCPVGTRCHAEITTAGELSRGVAVNDGIDDSLNSACYATRNTKKFPGTYYKTEKVY
jgi:hypothetical protein